MDNFKCLVSLYLLLSFCSASARSPDAVGPVESAVAKSNASETKQSPPTSPRSESNSQPGPPDRTADAQLFTDTEHGYSIRYPATWKREPPTSDLGPGVTLSLSTPHHGQFVVSIYPLPAPLPRYSSAAFDQIGHDHVDTVLSVYRRLLKIKQILREQPEDHSNDQSMIFWLGTSALDEQMKDWVLVTKHVIRYESDFMINMIFFGSHQNKVEEDGASMDDVMESLLFTAR